MKSHRTRIISTFHRSLESISLRSRVNFDLMDNPQVDCQMESSVTECLKHEIERESTLRILWSVKDLTPLSGERGRDV
jgi:hypothetical protein